MTLCAVKWCACLATNGTHCAIHAKNPKIRPDYLAVDEEFAPEMKPCEVCDSNGKCTRCKGSGTHTIDCWECQREHTHECAKCEGSGNCQTCHGEGRVTYVKKVGAA